MAAKKASAKAVVKEVPAKKAAKKTAKRSPATKESAKQPTQKLRIELEASASPARVAAAAAMIDQAIKAIDPLAGEEVTMVVNNRNLRSEVRGQSGVGNRIVKKIGDVLEHPDRSLAKSSDPRLPVVADVLAKGLEELGDTTMSLYWGARKTPFKRDSGKAIAGNMKDAAKRARKTLAAAEKVAPPPDYPTGERRLRTSFYTPIMRFGRTAEASKDQVRIVVFGHATEVDVEPDLTDVCARLTTTDHHVRVTITGRWGDRDGYEVLEDVRLVNVDPDDVAMTSQGFIDFISEHADVFADGLDGLHSRIRELRSE